MRRMAERAAPGRGQVVSAVLGGAAYVTDLECRLAPSFERAAPRPHAMASRGGLWSPAVRNNSGPLAEILGAAPPDAVQPRLRRALGDPEAGRDAWRRDVVPHLRDAEAGPRVRWTMARSPCVWAMPVRGALSYGIARASGPRSGPATARAAGRPPFRRTGALRPSRSWPSRCGPAPGRLACRPQGAPGTACTGIIARCGGGWRSTHRLMSWRSRARKMWGSARSRAR